MSCDSSLSASTPSTRNTSSSLHGERPLHEAPQLDRHRRVEFEPDHRAAPAALEHGLELAHQVFGLFLDFDVAVADDAEGALPLHRVAGEQPADEQAGRLLERDDPQRAVARRARQADEALDLVGHADQRVHRLAVARARKLQRDGEAEIGDERERMRRVDGERRQHRKDRAAGNGPPARPAPACVTSGAVDQHDAAARPAPGAARASAPAGRSPSTATASAMRTSCSAGVRPSGRLVVMPSRTWPLRPATRTMKNSSRLLAEIERKRSRSSSGWARWPPPRARGG